MAVSAFHPPEEASQGRPLSIPRRVTVVLLACVYGVAFVASPYWMLAGVPLTRVGVLLLNVLLGVVWLRYSAGEPRFTISARGLASSAILLAALVVVNYRALTSAIPWRGDESAHIFRTQLLVSGVPAGLFLLALIVPVVLIWAASKSWKLGLGLGLPALVGGVLFFWLSPEFHRENIEWIMHYPLVNYWAYMVPVKLATPAIGLFHEWLYRVIPFLSMAGVAWLIQRRLASGLGLPQVLWGLASATIPIILYYSSVLYLEPLGLFLMLAVCLDAHQLLREDGAKIRQSPAWYALIFIGFIRDTALLFLLCFLLARLVYRVSTAPGGGETARTWLEKAARGIREELPTAIAVLLPSVLYLALRSMLTAPERSFTPDWTVLGNWSIYRAVVQAVVEEFGPWLVFAIVGAAILWRRRDFLQLGFLAAVAASYTIFHAVDSHGIYAGYGRFNLFPAAALLAAALVGLLEVSRRRPRLALLVGSILLAGNVALSPVHLDGSRVPLWGTYLWDTGEHYYPYPQTLAWLQENAASRRILFTGMDYAYFLDFYFQQLDWQPRHQVELVNYAPDGLDDHQMQFDGLALRPERRLDAMWASASVPSESDELARALQSASAGKYGVVVYQVLGNSVPAVADTGQFVLAKVFRNQAHTLLVYFASR